MTDEEREAIEQLRNWREYIIKHKEDVNKANDIEFYLRTVINLIEKQSKEIEELKAKNKKHPIRFTDKQYNDAIRLAQKVEASKWKDKIKAKIEEDKLFFKTKDIRHANRYKAYKELLEKE